MIACADSIDAMEVRRIKDLNREASQGPEEVPPARAKRSGLTDQ
jgi:hypothetical protein